ncbi:prolipoprotein diacylglyceryl transferase [Desulfonatronovibrio hydrogenovorans]|uniref:prolipoprotein diacylglyceryl transferase n=1 Tax=Desulfonatronovibrio hydrogenovorans TaxID=53245 RepID=UPI000491C1AF|nr:prolipoprotein diacylglyceryl transferase [Desulfonatronovibrio hydrogenovorans]
MITYPDINPVAVEIGSIQLRWYGLMYLFGFTMAWLLARHRAGKPDSGWTRSELPDLITFCAFGVIIGARIGYVLFYDFPSFMARPWEMFMIWKGGMSFHGGLLGVIVCLFWYARKTGRPFFQVTDFIAPLAPLGLMFGRIGNFINGELWGRPAQVPWAMVFPDPAAGYIPRHPSQLYQAFLEGLLLFVILWIFSSRSRPRMAVSGLFCLGYGVFRFTAEFFRQPDAHLGFVFLDWMTMGQILSLPMALLGLGLLAASYSKKSPKIL